MRRPLLQAALGLLTLVGAAGVAAAEPQESEPAPAQDEAEPPAPEPGVEQAIEVDVHGRPVERQQPERAGSRVERRELEEQLARSAPEALRYEPGIYVQQTAHSQGSPFVRGQTGQRVLHLFDGVRLNNSTYRQGPNQYFFTVDTGSLASIEVTRGGASTLYGSDAIGGVIDAQPLEPRIDPIAEGVVLHPRAALRAGSADGQLAMRTQLDAQLAPALRVLGGFGGRKLGRLESGGPVCGPDEESCTLDSEDRALVPRFADDGRTQLGTGFRELTGDGRLVYSLGLGQRLVAATYLYRQLDAPRTDQCPPAYASIRECLTYDEQFRTLAYLRYSNVAGPDWARSLTTTASFQRQHERRTRRRPQSFIENGGRDDVTSIGVTARLRTAPLELASWLNGALAYGGELYADTVDSTAWTKFTDNGVVIDSSRGQYLAGSSYQQGGVYADVETRWLERLAVRLGGRAGWARADAPADPTSGTTAVDGSWPTVAAHAGLEVTVLPGWSLLANVDRSFRAPNLDDLTSRQQTGPGFQLENAALGPEAATTLEAGTRLVEQELVDAELWAFHTILYDGIVRAMVPTTECPAQTPQCAASWSRYRLVNLAEPATIDGIELSARALLPCGFSLRATLAYAVGEGPNPQPEPTDPSVGYEETVPLSRIPPLNGTVLAQWDSPVGSYLAVGVRWAATQDRLALSDQSDARIPPGGTPGFAVMDVRMGYRLDDRLLVSLLFENAFDAAYRYHGSSINGAGRGVIAHVEGGL